MAELEPRVEKLEEKVGVIEDKIVTIEHKAESSDAQIGRIVSHIESEGAAARTDLARIETRLFGAEDSEYGGKIGFLNRRMYRIEVWGLAIIAATAILVFAFTFANFIKGLK